VKSEKLYGNIKLYPQKNYCGFFQLTDEIYNFITFAYWLHYHISLADGGEPLCNNTAAPSGKGAG
jgi:hypothetical protein